MMQLWDKRSRRPVYTTCVQPLTPYKRKRSNLKVQCVTKGDGESYSLLACCIVSWVLVGVMFVRWWVG